MKILIFGCGKQASKYINLLKGNIIDIVTKSNLCDNKNINNTFYYDQIETINLDLYDYIILAIFPISEQTKVINYLIKIKVNSNIIIEKPVTYDLNLLKKLLKFNNITYNIDELPFGLKLGRNINIKNIKINISKYNFNIEHALSLFIFRKDFSFLLKNIKINNLGNSKELYYKIKFNGNNLIEIKKGSLFLNKIFIGNIYLKQSYTFLSNILLKNNYLNFLMKYNFLLLIKYLYFKK